MATETVSEPLCSDYCWLVVKRLNINKYILLECIKDYKLHYRYSELFFFFSFLTLWLSLTLSKYMKHTQLQGNASPSG